MLCEQNSQNIGTAFKPTPAKSNLISIDPPLHSLTVDDVQPDSGRLRVGRAAAVVAAVLPRHVPQGERRHEERRRHRRDGGRDGRAGVGRRHQSTGAVVPEQTIHL